MSKEVKIINEDGKLIRTYSEELNGKGYKKLADEFIKKQKNVYQRELKIAKSEKEVKDEEALKEAEDKKAKAKAEKEAKKEAKEKEKEKKK